ncbi:MAG: hypothetical protein AAFN27_18020 [Pseudomonadota bacterium]
MSKRFLVVTLTVAATFASFSAFAASTTFSDRDAFLNAGGEATNHTTPAIAKRTSPAAISDGLTITPTSSNFFSIANSPSGIPNALVFSDRSGENFNAILDEAVFGFGFDVFEPVTASLCNTATCIASTFQVSLFNGSNLVGSTSFTPLPSDTETTFFGIISTAQFDLLAVRETTGTNDNESFGNFTSVSAVPLPAPFALLLAGVGALISLRRWRPRTA